MTNICEIMTGVEIILLLIGAVFFISSFFITEKLQGSDITRIAKLSEDQLQGILDREMEEAKAKISDLVDDAMDLTVDQVKRTMERDTNEKIMAISEYSDAVTEKLEKMNTEVTFLYSMLGEKHTQLLSTVDQLNERMDAYQELVAQPIVSEQTTEAVLEDEPQETIADLLEETPEEEAPNTITAKEQILEHYRAGEDLTDIARTLGLGFGEVKLITELYKGEES